MPTRTDAPPATGRLRAAWNAAHQPVPGVPRWARRAAYAIPFTVLPSSLWRIGTVVLHLPLDDGEARNSGSLPPWIPIELYVILLSVLSELLAFTAVGLIARWGEVVPRWIPLLRGRTVPVRAAVLPAAAGSVILTVMWTGVAVTTAAGRTIQGHALDKTMPLSTFDWRAVVLAVTYAPLLLWGPLLAALTVHYRRRRRQVGASATEVQETASVR